MKLQEFYSDFLFEARYLSDEKFECVVNNMGDWLFEIFYRRPNLVKSLPFYNEFKSFLKSNTTEKSETDEEIVFALNRIGDFLNMLSAKDSQKFIKDITSTFPNLTEKINRCGKPESTGKRGRPVGSRNKPKDQPQIKPVPKPEPEIDFEKPIQKLDVVEPSRGAGRPKIYDDKFSAIDRFRYRKEGPEMIQSLELKVKSMDSQVNQIIGRIKKIMKDIDRRKEFFGIETEKPAPPEGY